MGDDEKCSSWSEVKNQLVNKQFFCNRCVNNNNFNITVMCHRCLAEREEMEQSNPCDGKNTRRRCRQRNVNT